MAALTKVKKDKLGLYVVCGGWIARPFFGTSFKEGDSVKSHHFGGSTNAGVTVPDKPETHNFKKSGQYEVWVTTGISSTNYQRENIPQGDLYSKFKTFDEYLVDITNWYKNHNKGLGKIYSDLNKKFKK